MKRLLIFITLITISLTLWAENFIVDSYDISLSVKEDQTIIVTESITVDFTTPSHGIYRDIQYYFKNPNGNFADPFVAKFSLLDSSVPYSLEDNDGYYRLYLGDEDKEVSGKEEYVIKYSFRLNKDLSDSYDELYYNIISPDWDTQIWDINWSIQMPKPIDKNYVWVTVGESGSNKKGNYTISSNNTLIEGHEVGLSNKGAITVRIEMDEGYWNIVKKIDNSNTYLYLTIAFSLLLLLISIIIWTLLGKDSSLNLSNRSIPPTGLSPLEVSFILNGSLKDNREFPAMLFYWAEGGYLTIEEKDINGEKKYTLHKIKALPEERAKSEKELFNLIFFKPDVSLEELASKNFSFNFYEKIPKELKTEFSKGERGLIDRKSSVLQLILLVCYLAISIQNGIFVSMKYPGELSLIFSLIFTILFIAFTISSLMWQRKSAIWKKKDKVTLLVLLSFLLVISIALSIFFAKITLLNLSLATLAIFSSTISITLGSFISGLVSKRSKYGQKILEECISYKNFIEENSNLLGKEEAREKTYNENMPYAIVMGGEKNWSEKFKDLKISSPSWLEGTTNGYPNYLIWYVLYSSFNTSYSNECVSHSESSNTSSDFSSFSAGGGFSGGGGGSW